MGKKNAHTAGHGISIIRIFVITKWYFINNIEQLKYNNMINVIKY